MLHSVEYWKKRLETMKDFGIRLRHVDDILLKFPEDYLQLREEIQKALKQNHLNLLYCRQEIATIKECD